MTTPTILPGLGTENWRGHVAPPQVRDQVINLLVGGAPFANSLTRDPTNRPSVAYPVASPTGFAWLAELQEFPKIDLADDAIVVAIKKLGGLIDLSNELVNDSSFNITAALRQLLSDGLSRDLDLGLLHGSGEDNQPVGVLGNAPAVSGADLLSAVSQAVGEIGDQGGTANTIAASAAAFAEANSTTATDGQLVFPSGFAPAVGLTPVTVPELATPLVYDNTRCYLVINGSDSEVAVSTDWRFNFDATSVRIKVRAAVAIPAPARSIRKLELAGREGRTATPAKATPAKKAT